MAKTFDALKRAEEERGQKAEVPAVTSSIIKMEPAHPPKGESAGVEILPGIPKLPRIRGLSFIVEEYQRMKHKIIHYDPDVIVKSMLFCSPGRREGTSTVLIHFAQTLAAEGNRVLLVDGNLRNPYLHQAFRVPRENGVSEVLLSRTLSRSIQPYIKRTNQENLGIITSGQPHPNPNSLLQSDYFHTFTDHLKEQWDWVLFDCPPVNSYSDSTALACKADGIVLVVQAEKTRWEVVQDARQRLEHCGGRVLGVVLNKRQFHIPNWIYNRI
jgi:capsular exopolysaccharide synthesis family protein